MSETHYNAHRWRTRQPGLIDFRVSLPTMPTDINNLLAWYKADALSLNNDDAVSAWADSSGNGYNLSQGTAANQPVFKTNILNGQPVVRFDNSNDYLIGSDVSFGSSPFSYILVYRRNVDGNNMRPLIKSGTEYAYLQYGSTWYVGSATATSAMTVDVFYIRTAIVDATTVYRYSNGSALGSQAKSGNMGLNGLGVAAYPFMGADVAEVILYQKALTDAERIALESRYLGPKYGL